MSLSVGAAPDVPLVGDESINKPGSNVLRSLEEIKKEVSQELSDNETLFEDLDVELINKNKNDCTQHELESIR